MKSDLTENNNNNHHCSIMIKNKETSNKDLIKICPAEVKREFETEYDNTYKKSNKKHQRFMSYNYNDLECKDISDIHFLPLNKSEGKEIGKDLIKFNKDKIEDLSVNMKQRELSKEKHRISTNLKDLNEINDSKSVKEFNNEQSENNTNNRKLSFFYNYRKQNNLIKDFKTIFKDEVFKSEIEKFSDLKISKNILERINMPPFRNVQIIPKITEDTENNDFFDNDLVEPLRINCIRILSFTISSISIFLVIILLIFLNII